MVMIALHAAATLWPGPVLALCCVESGHSCTIQLAIARIF